MLRTSLDRAEALFRKEERRRDGQEATAEYQTNGDAVREKTARLRALRLARDAAMKATPKLVAPTKKRSAQSTVGNELPK